MFTVRGKMYIPPLIIHVKTDRDLTGRRSKSQEVNIAGIDILARGNAHLADDLPGSWIDRGPVGCEVYIVNCRITRMLRIGIGCEVYLAG